MKFLVPIDFSPSAANASLFAAKLAQATEGASIHFIYALVPDSPPESKPTDISENCVMRMYLCQEIIRKKFDVTSSSDIVIGEIADGILQTAKTSAADMIVMGTSGNSGLKRILWGSNTASIIERSGIPVITLPEKAGNVLPKRIAYATDYSGSDIKDLQEVAAFADQINAEIITLHVASPGQSENQYFSDLIRKNISYTKISTQVIEPINSIAGLKMYLQEEGINMLAIAAEKRNVLQHLFNKTLTKDFIADLEIPVMIFHV